MISSAEEFVALRMSARQEDYLRAAHEAAALSVWRDVLERYPEMKIWVAHNKTVPMSILQTLATDPDPGVRMSVAMKNKLSQGVMFSLASDPDEAVRQRIAYNKNAPVAVLERLALDESEFVSTRARERLTGLKR